jgi:hypothetical protein
MPDSTLALLAYLQAQSRNRMGEASTSWCLWVERALDRTGGGRPSRALTALATQCPGGARGSSR